MNQLVDSPYFTLYEMTSGIFAAISKPGKGSMGNAGVVDLGEELLVFDTFTTPKAAKDLNEHIQTLTGKRVKYVVNSHYHGDHTFGNQVFEDATIFSTELTRQWHLEKNKIVDLEEEKHSMIEYLAGLKERIKNETNEINLESLKRQYGDIEQVLQGLDELEMVGPTVSFQDHLKIYGLERSVDLYCFGGGHTISDAVMLVPDQGILFAGDLILQRQHPLIYNSNSFIENLNDIKQLEFKSIVTGHGGIVSRSQIDIMIDYLNHVKEEARTLLKNGTTLQEIREWTLTPKAYAHWGGVDGYQRSLFTLYNELKENEFGS